MKVTAQTSVVLEWVVNNDPEMVELQDRVAANGDTVEKDGEAYAPGTASGPMQYIQHVLLTTTVEKALRHYGEDAASLCDNYLDEDDYPNAEAQVQRVADTIRQLAQDERTQAMLYAAQ